MKPRALIIAVTLAALNLNAQELKTTIDEVIVFQNGAQVIRAGNTTLPVGTHELKVKDISPLLKKESIQVKGEGDFTILSVNYQVNLTEQKPDLAKIKELDLRKKNLENDIEDINTKLAVLYSEEQLINSLHQMSNRDNATVETVVKARQAVQLQLGDIKSKQQTLNRDLKSKKEVLQEVTQELASKRIPKSTSINEIAIKVMAKKETKADFKVMYIVTNARWFPSYDLRVNSINEPLVMEYKAHISQQTGEDWTNVKLKLSTTDPSQTGQKPVMKKWDLYLNQNYNQPAVQNNYQKYTPVAAMNIKGLITDEYGEPMPFATVMAVGSTVGTTTDENGYYSMSLPQGVTQITVKYIGYSPLTVNVSGENMNIVLQPDAKELQEVSIISYRDPLIDKDASSVTKISRNDIVRMPSRSASAIAQTVGGADVITGGTPGSYGSGSRSKKYAASSSVPVQVRSLENIVSTTFVIEERYSVLSDAKSYMVSIQNISASANYQYYCAPKLDRDVFLTAQLTHWEDYNLLEGQTNIYFEGTYVGTGLMDVRYLTDTLNISLGRDKNILVERKKAKELNKRKALSNDATAFRDWDINIRNTKQQKVNIIVEDQFPVAMDTRIEVQREENSGGKVNDLTGIVTWDLQLESKTNKALKLKYTVKHPKNSFVGLD